MIIKSSRNNSKFVYKPEEKPAIVSEEVKPLNNEIIQKPKRKKSAVSIVVEEPIVVEEKVEDEDLSTWLEEHIED